jgi:hypothetical protein
MDNKAARRAKDHAGMDAGWFQFLGFSRSENSERRKTAWMPLL